MSKFNKNWKFFKGNINGAHLNDFDDSEWETVDIPHDWSIEGEFDKEKGEGCTAYFLGVIGWYRKKFNTTKEMSCGITVINFDGIYNNADIYINGKYLGFHPYGYSPFYYDISQYLKNCGEENVIAVRVDHSRYADSRWYIGSGIYRNVKLEVYPKIGIPTWGITVSTPVVSEKYASVELISKIENKTCKQQNIKIRATIQDSNNQIICSLDKVVKFEENESKDVKHNFIIEKPKLWDIENPHLYLAKLDVILDDKIIQSKTVNFGIRECKFDKDKGFFLNGKHVYIKGVCLHHDAGLVGAAVPKDVWRRRLKILKDCGCNAIRTAHNPASEEFLELCDEMGFLVQEEFFDEWDNPKDKRKNCNEVTVDYITRSYTQYFKEWAKRDLQNTILRDRNHPCIFQWSIGNEIEWTYPKYNLATGYFGADATGGYFWTLPPYSIEKIRKNISMLPQDKDEIGETAKKLSKWVKEIDTTRPVIANCILPSASYESGYTDALDIVGYSYRRVIYDYGHKNYGDKPIMGTENVAQWHEWKAVLERPFVSGIFVWTGFDYLGEAGVEHNKPWPIKGSNSGMIDYAGFPKPSYYMMKSLWDNRPNLHIETQILEKSLYKLNEKNELEEKVKDGWKHRLWEWHDVNRHWNYKKGDLVVIEIYSNCDEIDLMLNGKSLGKKYLKDFEDHIYKWIVTFEEGVLEAIGKKDGKEVRDKIYTTTQLKNISLVIDKKELKEGEVAHCIAQLVDQNGHYITCMDEEVEFVVEGDIKVLGIDNGAIDSVQPYKSTKCVTSKGRCLLLLQATRPGKISVYVKSKEICSEKLGISVL